MKAMLILLMFASVASACDCGDRVGLLGRLGSRRASSTSIAISKTVTREPREPRPRRARAQVLLVQPAQVAMLGFVAPQQQTQVRVLEEPHCCQPKARIQLDAVPQAEPPSPPRARASAEAESGN